MLVQRFRKNPVEIEAIQFHGDNWGEVQLFCGTHRDSGNQWDISTFNEIGTYSLSEDSAVIAEVWDKLHSTWVGVKFGQWIIKGLQGEFYPWDQDIFEASYSRVDDNVDYPVIGPECFTTREGDVICYKGENYYKACDELVYEKEDGGAAYCIFPSRFDHEDHVAFDGTKIKV